jgi:TonB family protein
MKIPCLLMFVAIEVVALLCAAAESSAQAKPSSEAPEQEVVLSKLSSPVYPPLARQARISGDVDLALRIRQDGSVESAEVVSGHPLLKEAALDSAKKSEFECHGCKETLTTYSLVYTFGLTTNEKCCEAPENSAGTEKATRSHAGVVQSQNHVTIFAEPTCICDPSAEISKVRSAKCLYLWRCGLR